MRLCRRLKARVNVEVNLFNGSDGRLDLVGRLVPQHGIETDQSGDFLALEDFAFRRFIIRLIFSTPMTASFTFTGTSF